MIVRKRAGANSKDSTLLKDGKDYFVFALLLGDAVSFLVEEESAFSFPFFVGESSVDVVDGRIPETWRYLNRVELSASFSSRRAMIAPEEFEDPFFYQRLVDGDSDARGRWRRLN